LLLAAYFDSGSEEARQRKEQAAGVLHELEWLERRERAKRKMILGLHRLTLLQTPSHQNIGTNFLLVAVKYKDEINKGFIALYPSANSAHMCNSLLVLFSDFNQENLVGVVCASRPSSYAHEYSHGSI
jgi:hypothetical protein